MLCTYAVYVRIISIPLFQTGVWDCWTFIDPWSAKVYVTWFVLSVFILPLVVIGLSYGAICFKVVSFNLPSGDGKKGGNGVARTSSSQKEANGRYRKKHSFSSSSVSERRAEESETIDNVPLQKVRR
jgi:hypothetical protein